MDDLLTARQVLDILKVDRITIYRMLKDGRIKGVKVGQQWRFPRQEVDRIINGEPPLSQTSSAEAGFTFPTHCVQMIQDLFSEVGQISALVVDFDGNPLTEISYPCRFCQVLLQSPSGQNACQESWSGFARQSREGSHYFTCHAGIQYISAPILDEGKAVGYFLTGQFYWQAPDSSEEARQARKLASKHNLSAKTLEQAADTVPVITEEQRPRIEAWPAAAARAIQSILHERSGFIVRLQQIANLTQIH